MFDIEFSSFAKKFLKRADKALSKRLVNRIEELASDPFPKDTKRVVNKKEKVFRIRVGDYRVQYLVYYERNLLFVSDIDKRPRAY